MWFKKVWKFYLKHRFNHHKIDLDPANLRNYYVDVEIFRVNKSHFGGNNLSLFHVDGSKRTSAMK